MSFVTQNLGHVGSLRQEVISLCWSFFSVESFFVKKKKKNPIHMRRELILKICHFLLHPWSHVEE